MIEIKNRFTGAILKTCEVADLSGANLRYADLSRADLSGANLRYADLSRADLSDAYLSGADLSRADLSDAYLRGADLSGADLRGADLSRADLSDAEGYDKTIKMPIFCKWTHGITNGNLIHIGCEKRTIESWDTFFASDKVLETNRNTTEFKQIEAVYNAYKAYLTFLNK